MKKIYPTSFVTESNVASPHFRLFCFPYAGGNSTIYRGWQSALGPKIEVIAVELPGRGIRFGENPVGNLNSLVRELSNQISTMMELPYAFFGHSNGALICFELARRLKKIGQRIPQRLILSGKAPPHIKEKDSTVYLSDQEFIEKLRTMNGTPLEILNNSDLMTLLLPMIRADFSLSETYELEECDPLNCELNIFAGEEDDTPRDVILEWAQYVSGEIKMHMFDGGHFFINSCRQSVLNVLDSILNVKEPSPSESNYKDIALLSTL